MTGSSHRTLWLVLGWAGIAVVVILSLLPNPPHTGVSGGDKIGHLLAYFGLMFWFGQLYRRHLPWALGFLALGAVLEVIQGLTGYRETSLADLLANATGIALGWLAARRWPHCLGHLEARGT